MFVGFIERYTHYAPTLPSILLVIHYEAYCMLTHTKTNDDSCSFSETNHENNNDERCYEKDDDDNDDDDDEAFQ